ncbi:MAG: type II toxin-antitoxin system HicB family antitoxin [Pirellulales bacterium]
MPLSIETEQEVDGRWVAEIPELPGVLAYGATCQEAVDRAKALSLRVLADRIEHGEPVPQVSSVFATLP